MSHIIVMLERNGERRYCEWSTIMDAPLSCLLPRDEFIELFREKKDQEALLQLPQRLKRADDKGTSSYDGTRAGLLDGNRAGPNETHLTETEIWDRYSVGGTYYQELNSSDDEGDPTA